MFDYKSNILKFVKIHKINWLLNLILLLLYFSLSSQSYEIFKIDFFSEITITINKTGKQNILSKGIRDYSSSSYATYSSYYGPLPDEVYVNGVIQSQVEEFVKLTEKENIITMRWNSPI